MSGQNGRNKKVPQTFIFSQFCIDLYMWNANISRMENDFLKIVDSLTGRPQMAGRPSEEQTHELDRKWKV